MIDWEEMKNRFKHLFYCPKKNEFYLVKEGYTFVHRGKRSKWYRYADSKLFGKDIRVDKTKTWVYLGEA